MGEGVPAASMVLRNFTAEASWKPTVQRRQVLRGTPLLVLRGVSTEFMRLGVRKAVSRVHVSEEVRRPPEPLRPPSGPGGDQRVPIPMLPRCAKEPWLGGEGARDTREKKRETNPSIP